MVSRSNFGWDLGIGGLLVSRWPLAVSCWQSGYTPTLVIFWNHEVSGRTRAKSLERNELRANIDMVRLSGMNGTSKIGFSAVSCQLSALSYQLLAASFWLLAIAVGNEANS